MSRMVHEFSSPVQDEHEKRYTARVRGDEDHGREVASESDALVAALADEG